MSKRCDRGSTTRVQTFTRARSTRMHTPSYERTTKTPSVSIPIFWRTFRNNQSDGHSLNSHRVSNKTRTRARRARNKNTRGYCFARRTLSTISNDFHVKRELFPRETLSLYSLSRSLSHSLCLCLSLFFWPLPNTFLLSAPGPKGKEKVKLS